MLTPEYLISPWHSADALTIAGSDHTFKIYLHLTGASVSVAVGTQYFQEISPLPFPEHLVQHLHEQLHRISSNANVSFQIVFEQHLADIAFFYDSQLDVGDGPGGTTLGITLNHHDIILNRRWIEIFLNGSELDNSSFDLQAYVINHELLHSLGFEHTFDDRDGDYYLSTDPLLSATPGETTMSYRSPETGVYPTDLSEADYMALIDIWGPPTPASTTISPSDTSVYRLYQPSSGMHLFSANNFEIDLLTQGSQPFIHEGIAFNVGHGADVDVHRFYNHLSNHHLYSTNSFEMQLLMDNTDYIHEGISFKVFDIDSAEMNRMPVFRFYDSDSGHHYLTSSQQERSIWQTFNSSWLYEGIAWYA